MIFNIQTIRIQRELAGEFDFMFIDGPFDSPPGPGVMPTFEGCVPFCSWAKPGVDGMPDETRELITDVVREHEFVGVLGFSQGGKLTAGLLLEQQLEDKARAVGDGDVERRTEFRFGVICMGTSPPLTSPPFGLPADEIITIPTVHLIGKEDEWKDLGKALYNDYFDHDRSKMLVFDVGHRLPTELADTKKVADEIRRLHRETSGGSADLSEIAA